MDDFYSSKKQQQAPNGSSPVNGGRSSPRLISAPGALKGNKLGSKLIENPIGLSKSGGTPTAGSKPGSSQSGKDAMKPKLGKSGPLGILADVGISPSKGGSTNGVTASNPRGKRGQGNSSPTGADDADPLPSAGIHQNSQKEDSFQKLYSKELDLDEDEVPIILHELNDSAIHFISHEQFERSLSLLQKAQTLLDRLQFQKNPKDRFLIQVTMHNMALCFQKMGALEECALCLDACLHQINSQYLLPNFSGKPTRKLKKLKYECKIHMQVCALLSQLHRHQEALCHAKRAVQISQYLILDLLSLCKVSYNKSIKAKKREQIVHEEQEQAKANDGGMSISQNSSKADLIYYDDNISMLERTAFRIYPIMKEIASRMVKHKDLDTLESSSLSKSKKQTINSKENTKKMASKRQVLDISDCEEELNDLGSESQPLNMKVLLGYLNQSEWLYLLNIGNIMQITPLTIHDLYSNQKIDVELSRDSILEKISFLAISYFCVSTELRFLVSSKEKLSIDPVQVKSESEFWHGKALEISCGFLPSESPLVTHILSSYQKHHAPVQQAIPEDSEADQGLRVIRPERGIDKSQFQPMIRINKNLNIALSPLSLSPCEHGAKVIKLLDPPMTVDSKENKFDKSHNLINQVESVADEQAENDSRKAKIQSTTSDPETPKKDSSSVKKQFEQPIQTSMEINPSSIELSSSVHAIIADEHERYKNDKNKRQEDSPSPNKSNEDQTSLENGNSSLIFGDHQMTKNIDEQHQQIFQELERKKRKNDAKIDPLLSLQNLANLESYVDDFEENLEGVDEIQDFNQLKDLKTIMTDLNFQDSQNIDVPIQDEASKLNASDNMMASLNKLKQSEGLQDEADHSKAQTQEEKSEEKSGRGNHQQAQHTKVYLRHEKLSHRSRGANQESSGSPQQEESATIQQTSAENDSLPAKLSSTNKSSSSFKRIDQKKSHADSKEDGVNQSMMAVPPSQLQAKQLLQQQLFASEERRKVHEAPGNQSLLVQSKDRRYDDNPDVTRDNFSTSQGKVNHTNAMSGKELAGEHLLLASFEDQMRAEDESNKYREANEVKRSTALKTLKPTVQESDGPLESSHATQEKNAVKKEKLSKEQTEQLKEFLRHGKLTSGQNSSSRSKGNNLKEIQGPSMTFDHRLDQDGNQIVRPNSHYPKRAFTPGSIISQPGDQTPSSLSQSQHQNHAENVSGVLKSGSTTLPEEDAHHDTSKGIRSAKDTQRGSQVRQSATSTNSASRRRSRSKGKNTVGNPKRAESGGKHNQTIVSNKQSESHNTTPGGVRPNSRAGGTAIGASQSASHSSKVTSRGNADQNKTPSNRPPSSTQLRKLQQQQRPDSRRMTGSKRRQIANSNNNESSAITRSSSGGRHNQAAIQQTLHVVVGTSSNEIENYKTAAAPNEASKSQHSVANAQAGSRNGNVRNFQAQQRKAGINTHHGTASHSPSNHHLNGKNQKPSSSGHVGMGGLGAIQNTVGSSASGGITKMAVTGGFLSQNQSKNSGVVEKKLKVKSSQNGRNNAGFNMQQSSSLNQSRYNADIGNTSTTNFVDRSLNHEILPGSKLLDNSRLEGGSTSLGNQSGNRPRSLGKVSQNQLISAASGSGLGQKKKSTVNPSQSQNSLSTNKHKQQKVHNELISYLKDNQNNQKSSEPADDQSQKQLLIKKALEIQNRVVQGQGAGGSLEIRRKSANATNQSSVIGANNIHSRSSVTPAGYQTVQGHHSQQHGVGGQGMSHPGTTSHAQIITTQGNQHHTTSVQMPNTHPVSLQQTNANLVGMPQGNGHLSAAVKRKVKQQQPVLGQATANGAQAVNNNNTQSQKTISLQRLGITLPNAAGGLDPTTVAAIEYALSTQNQSKQLQPLGGNMTGGGSQNAQVIYNQLLNYHAQQKGASKETSKSQKKFFKDRSTPQQPSSQNFMTQQNPHASQVNGGKGAQSRGDLHHGKVSKKSSISPSSGHRVISQGATAYQSQAPGVMQQLSNQSAMIDNYTTTPFLASSTNGGQPQGVNNPSNSGSGAQVSNTGFIRDLTGKPRNYQTNPNQMASQQYGTNPQHQQRKNAQERFLLEKGAQGHGQREPTPVYNHEPYQGKKDSRSSSQENSYVLNQKGSQQNGQVHASNLNFQRQTLSNMYQQLKEKEKRSNNYQPVGGVQGSNSQSSLGGSRSSAPHAGTGTNNAFNRGAAQKMHEFNGQDFEVRANSGSPRQKAISKKSAVAGVVAAVDNNSHQISAFNTVNQVTGKGTKKKGAAQTHAQGRSTKQH